MPDWLGSLHRWYFDRAIAAWGQGVQTRVEKAGQHRNPVIAQSQKTQEWNRLMGGDMADSFADLSGAPSTHSRVRGADERDEEEVVLDGGPWW